MADRPVLPTAAELIERIDWLIRLRWLAVLGVLCTLAVSWSLFRAALPWTQLVVVTCGLAAYNLVFWLFSRRILLATPPRGNGKPSRWLRILVPRSLWDMELEGVATRAVVLACAQITLDLLFLALLLHYSGGIENPFVYFFLFHAIIASILLSRRATYLQVGFGFLLTSAFAIGEYSGLLAHHPLAGSWRLDRYDDPTFVAMRLLILGTTLFISVYLCSSIAVRLRARMRDDILMSRELAIKADALERAYVEIRESEKARSTYMRKVAHELRGPLGTIRSALGVVLQGLTGDLPEQARDLVQRAAKRADELSAVTTDLLQLSRARGALPGELLERLDLAVIVRDSLVELERAAKAASLDLSWELPSGTATLDGDPQGLRELVDNLVANAIRYTPSGGRVSVRLQRVGAQLRLEVEDTGIGIAAEDQARIFDEFFRSANAREQTLNGTGLGLSIVKAVVEHHGGRVEVDSTIGTGSRFTVDLPADTGP